MTEIELNEQLALLSENLSKNPTAFGHLHSGRQYRRRKQFEKSNRRLSIVRLPSYAPHRGYVDRDDGSKTLLHSGKYIKYPKNSSCQRQLKKATSKKVRSCPHLPAKGNGYRKVFDYWWTLY